MIRTLLAGISWHCCYIDSVADTTGVRGAVTVPRNTTHIGKAVVIWPLITVCLVFLSGSLRAQTVPAPPADLGFVPYAISQTGPLDALNLGAGNFVIKIPLVEFPQRGALSLSFSIYANSRAVSWYNFATSTLGGTVYHWSPGPVSMPQFNSNQDWYINKVRITPKSYIYSYQANGPDGSVHPLGVMTYNMSGNGYMTARTVDATGLSYSGGVTQVRGTADPPDVLIFSNGTRHSSGLYGNTTIEDTNGNQISYVSGISTGSAAGWTDSLGRFIPSPVTTGDFSGCTGRYGITSASAWSIPSPYGGTATYKLCYATVPIQSNFNLSSAPLLSYQEYTGTMSLLQSVVLPDMTAWTFDYDDRNPGDPASVNYGTLTRITAPTGAAITYTYATWDFGVSCGGWPARYSRYPIARAVDAQDGAGPHTWTYSWTPRSPGCAAESVIATDPVGNQSVYTLTNFGWGYYETLRQIYQGAQRVLIQTVATDYSYVAGSYQQPGGGSQATSVVPIRQTTSWANGSTKKTEYDYDDASFSFAPQLEVTKALSTTPFAGTLGKIIAQRDYDYGTGASGSLLRARSATYLCQSTSSYFSMNIIDPLYSETVSDGSNNVIAQSRYRYDETEPVASGVAVQHDSSPQAGLYRGNQTSVGKWLNTTNSYLTTTSTYYDTGMVQQIVDPLMHTTTYGYGDPQNTGAYPTSICNAANQCSTYTYDYDTGLRTGFTDPNGQTIGYNYDFMRRPVTIAYPDGGETDFYYPNPVMVETHTKM